ncbi:hypothetical protein F7725_026719 [Dissostichus mawsoni]|uniref:C-type lectin domain-containing protein n=1 Tax=Dissostichus mawsoni TaxID=36200 RepID=A0A7J5X7T4_DISMA|nr:hypothetical protein F7725_026719 [Dissostichus mawsoni]
MTKVWAGLRFLAGHWVWVNGASMVYSHLPPCPPVEQVCGVLSKNGTGRVEITDCTEKRNFLSTVSGLGSVVQRYYVYVQEHLNWQEAQSYCRKLMKKVCTWRSIMPGSACTKNKTKDWHGAMEKAPTTSFPLHILPNTATKNAYHVRRCETYYFFFCHHAHGNYLDYELILQSKTWSEALQYCKREFTDLATFRSIEDLDKDVEEQVFQVWTGLHRDGETWSWSTGVSDFRNWAEDEPGNNGDCVSSLNKEMATQNCSTRFPFVCLRHNLVVVKENKTWREALDHCRVLNSPYNSNIRFELVSVQPEDHDNVMNKVKEGDTEEVSVGRPPFPGRSLGVGERCEYGVLPPPPCPPVEQGCGVLSKNGTGRVEITDCTEKRNFLCYSSY